MSSKLHSPQGDLSLQYELGGVGYGIMSEKGRHEDDIQIRRVARRICACHVPLAPAHAADSDACEAKAAEQTLAGAEKDSFIARCGQRLPTLTAS